MTSIFACLNHSPGLSRDFAKAQFQQGKARGPDFSKFGSVGIQIYMGSHHSLKHDLQEDDIDIPYTGCCDIRVIYAGNITNLRELSETEEDPTRILVQLYRDYGFEQMLLLLKGQFSIMLLDQSVSVEFCLLYVARDALGLAPLYISDSSEEKGPIAFASEKSMLTGFGSPRQFPAGTYSTYQLTNGVYQTWYPVKTDIRYYTLPLPNVSHLPAMSVSKLLDAVVDSIGHRVSEHPIGCMISGGLKSAVVAAILAKSIGGKLKTFFVGFTDDPMALPSGYKRAEILARYIGSDHTAILLSKFDYEEALEEVRERFSGELEERELRNAAVFFAGAKWIRDRTGVKEVYLGAGMDELVGLDSEVDPVAYDKLAREALRAFPYGTGLSIDRCFGAFGLDVRMPFLDRDLVDYYFRMPVIVRMESRGNIETCFSLAIANSFFDRYLDWDIVKCRAKSPYKSAFSKGT
jgi:asparagine synthase (glutamine-hydrolysing)